VWDEDVVPDPPPARRGALLPAQRQRQRQPRTPGVAAEITEKVATDSAFLAHSSCLMDLGCANPDNISRITA
jgi:hypothetical protein